MPRHYGSTGQGGNFTPVQINATWNKGGIVAGYDSAQYRVDVYGTWMCKSDYGNVASEMGWEIDHILPVSAGGTDHYDNLQPLQWRNNRNKADRVF